jgi:carbamoyltransferase
MQGGQLVAAAQEERFSRIKNDKAFPADAFRYCLDHGGLTIAEVDCVAFYENPSAKLGRQLWMGMLPGSAPNRRALIQDRVLWNHPVEEIQSVTGYSGAIEIVDHHLSHAASAFFFSGFDDAAILTIDGVGEWQTTTYNAAQGVKIACLDSVDFPDSLGFFYSAITGYLGFEVNEGEYKVMGLAPYGQPRFAPQVREMIKQGPEGGFQLDLRFYSFLTADRMFSDGLIELLGMPPRAPGSDITQFHMDVARSAQVVLEEILLAKVRYLHGMVPSDNLCMAGGVALNVVANSRCLKDGPFKHLFVQPAAGDAGACLGAAAVAHARCIGERPSRPRLDDVFLGPANDPGETWQALDSSGVCFKDYRGDTPALLEQVVDALVDGKVVAWVSGRMEFGPRSLGARSILADPRRPEMQARINSVVKQRESFRPFAPAVLEQFAREHFALDHPSPFMLETCQVISPIRLPAVTHVDGSARVQTVTAVANSRFAALLAHFHRRTGCPILLNTSFNLRGEPIVCTIHDAISTFGRSMMDLLVLDDFIVEQSDIPPMWRQFARAPRRGAQDYAVYAML